MTDSKAQIGWTAHHNGSMIFLSIVGCPNKPIGPHVWVPAYASAKQ